MVAGALPVAVQQGIDAIDKDLWGMPRSNPENTRRRVAAKLTLLPIEVWSLEIDWVLHTNALHMALAVKAPRRTASDERKAHNAIAAKLNAAAHLLRAEHETDVYVDVLMGLLPHFGAPASTWSMPKVDLLAAKRGPKLSEFLRAFAKMYDGSQGRVVGLGELEHWSGTWTTNKKIGANAAAAQAFENVTTLLRRLTGKPHNKLATEMVIAYHPDADNEVEFARSARARALKNGKTQPK